MRKEVETLRTEIKQLSDEVAELRQKIRLVLDDNRNRDGFMRQVLIEVGNAILISGQSNPQLEHYARFKRLVLGFQAGDDLISDELGLLTEDPTVESMGTKK